MIHLAVDVAKAELDTFDGERSLTVQNTEDGIRKRLKALPPQSVVALEPTSTYGDLLARLAYEEGHTVYIVQPSWIKAHRRSCGIRAKTDRVDAKQIHDYILKNKGDLHPWRPLCELLQELKGLVRQRQSLADDIARARQRYRALQMNPQHIDMLLDGMKKAKKELDKSLKTALAKIPTVKVLLGVPGIGIRIAATVIVFLEHIAFVSSDSFIAFSGLDPVPNDSGTVKGQRRISKRGDVFVRRALYMAAMAACSRAPWKERYQSLKARGLKPKQALIALAKKIATIVFHLHRKQIAFDPEMVKYKGPQDNAGKRQVTLQEG